MPILSPYPRDVYTWTVPGQPIPAPRLTQATARHPSIPRGYYAYKAAVVAGLLDAYPGDTALMAHMVTMQKPFVFQEEGYGPRAIVEYWLWFQTAATGTCTHGDPDNVVKAILDALFGQDRHVLPRCMGLACDVSEPLTRIQLTLCQQEQRRYGKYHDHNHVRRQPARASGHAR